MHDYNFKVAAKERKPIDDCRNRFYVIYRYLMYTCIYVLYMYTQYTGSEFQNVYVMYTCCVISLYINLILVLE